MTMRQTFRFPLVNPEYIEPEVTHSPAMHAEWETTAHRGESGAETCTWRVHEVPHPATIRLTPDPDPGVRFPHRVVRTVCRCCAFERGHLYEEMRGEARSSGHVGVELRQPDGTWM